MFPSSIASLRPCLAHLCTSSPVSPPTVRVLSLLPSAVRPLQSEPRTCFTIAAPPLSLPYPSMPPVSLSALLSVRRTHAVARCQCMSPTFTVHAAYDLIVHLGPMPLSCLFCMPSSLFVALACAVTRAPLFWSCFPLLVIHALLWLAPRNHLSRFLSLYSLSYMRRTLASSRFALSAFPPLVLPLVWH